MTRLALVRAEIAQIEQHLHAVHEDDSFHPWIEPEAAPRIERMRTRLRKLRQEEFMLSHHSLPLVTDNMPLYRQHGHVEPQPSFMVAFLVLFALVCIAVVMLLAAAGVLV